MTARLLAQLTFSIVGLLGLVFLPVGLAVSIWRGDWRWAVTGLLAFVVAKFCLALNAKLAKEEE